MMLLVRILFIDSSLHKPVDWFTEFSFAWGQAMSSLGELIRPICITILYHNLLLFIDIFHIMDMILMLFPLFCMYDDYEGNDCRNQILMENAPSRHHIYEDQKLREKLFYGVLHQKTEVAKSRRPGGP